MKRVYAQLHSAEHERLVKAREKAKHAEETLRTRIRIEAREDFIEEAAIKLIDAWSDLGIENVRYQNHLDGRKRKANLSLLPAKR